MSGAAVPNPDRIATVQAMLQNVCASTSQAKELAERIVVAFGAGEPKPTDDAVEAALDAPFAVTDDMKASLRDAGWDPDGIQDDPEREGPYVVIREKDALCGQCGGTTLGWSVVDLERSTGIGISWTHDDGEVDATERAAELNRVWLRGRQSTVSAAYPTLSPEAIDQFVEENPPDDPVDDAEFGTAEWRRAHPEPTTWHKPPPAAELNAGPEFTHELLALLRWLAIGERQRLRLETRWTEKDRARFDQVFDAAFAPRVPGVTGPREGIKS